MKIVLAAAVLAASLALSWGGAAAAPLEVLVTIPPQAHFVKRIAGETASVSVLVPPGADPHAFEPKPQQMVALSRAALYFTVGFPLEKAWTAKLASANPKMRIVDTREGIALRPMEAHDHGDHGKAHRHADEPDPHIWLSPPLVMLQARTIFTALAEAAPASRSLLEDNYRRFASDLVALDLRLQRLFAEKRDAPFMILHPAWGYFAQAYGLRQIPIEREGKEPKGKDLAALIEAAKKDGVRAVFVQPRASAKTAEALASAVGARLLPADDLAENWEENLLATAERLRETLK